MRSIWAYESQISRVFEHVLPTAAGQLLINLHEEELRHWCAPGLVRQRVGPVGLQGALTRPVLIDGDQKREICGVAFHAGGFSAFHDLPATNFVDTIIDGEGVWGAAPRELYAALKRKPDADQRLDTIEAFLLRHLRHRPDEDRVLGGVAAQIACGTPVSDVRKNFGLSQRSLHALFDRRIGVRPKLFARLERFAAALDAMPDQRSWCDLAAAEGFSDQAHFVREFHAFSGSPPSRHIMVQGETRHAEPASDKIFNTAGGA